jgi:hypothetical protein
MCCALKQECGSYWYDLGLSYLFQYMANMNLTIQTKEFNVELINKAIECLINAINLQNENDLFWNVLGILYACDGKFNKTH